MDARASRGHRWMTPSYVTLYRNAMSSSAGTSPFPWPFRALPAKCPARRVQSLGSLGNIYILPTRPISPLASTSSYQLSPLTTIFTRCFCPAKTSTNNTSTVKLQPNLDTPTPLTTIVSLQHQQSRVQSKHTRPPSSNSPSTTSVPPPQQPIDHPDRPPTKTVSRI